MGEEPKKELLELDDPAATDAVEGAESGLVQRPTVAPSFDPAQYAEEFEMRERMPTVTDETALEQARQASFPTKVPPPRDSFAEIDTGEADIDELAADEQVAILSASLAPLTRVPALAREMKELGSLLDDPQTAYVLGFVDGILPLETIIEVAGLPELDTLRILARMVAQSVVVFRTR